MSRLFYVGGYEGGKDDYTLDFFNKGLWRVFYGPGTSAYNTALSMKKGDVLLLKKQLGRGSTEVMLLAAGYVVSPYGESEDNPGDHFCFVEWCVEKCAIRIPHQGLIKAIQERNEGDVDRMSQRLFGLVGELFRRNET